MREAVLVKTLAELLPYADQNKIVEIVMRSANKRYRAFQKVALADLQQGEVKELMEKTINALDQVKQASAKNLEVLQKIAQVQGLGLALNGLNLCATCAGFAIMYAKLDKMSAKINQQIGKLQSDIKHSHDVQTSFEFNKVLADYQDMLDSRRRQHPYSEAQMRELVDREYNVLILLIDVLRNDLAFSKQTMLDSVFSMLAMLTVSLRYFDEQYYFNNHEALGDMDVWHSSHEKWMNVYDDLSTPWFVELLQDYGLFEAGLNTVEVDLYYTDLIEQIADLRHEVEDNQILIITVGDPERLRALHEITDRDIKETIKSAIDTACGGADPATVDEVRRNALTLAAAV